VVVVTDIPTNIGDPLTAPLLLLDTSAALALISPGHPLHAAVLEAARGHTLGLAGQAVFEVYSALTRPGRDPLVDPERAIQVIEQDFPHTKFIQPVTFASLMEEFADLGIRGVLVYDALAGAAARDADIPLLSCNDEARHIYAALGAEHRIVTDQSASSV
jgi:predicted nucleic acid-binding protein